MDVTYLGHACFLMEVAGKKLLFDPFITGNPLAEDIALESLHPDYILISHGHGDHTLDVEEIGKRSGAMLISNYEVIQWFDKKGLTGHGMNIGGKVNLPFGTVRYVHATHSSSMPDGSYGGNPGGFVVWNDDVCFYFAGDTALHADMALIPKLCPALDFAILPVGDYFTMGYEDALLATELIECKKIIGAHFDTFDPIKIDHGKAIKLFSNNGVELILPGIGETLNVNRTMRTKSD